MNKIDARILLVEDEPTLQFVVEMQLGKLGYKVAAKADNGLIAVEQVLGHPYDLVFMDVNLPGIDGMMATSRIRAAEQDAGRHTKIVGMTAFAERQRCLDSGMDDYLQKPVLLEQVSAILEKWLNSDGQPYMQVAASDLSQFRRTANRLDAIQERISNLRKRVGLES